MQGIIFDMDGLMIDSERIINAAVVRAGHDMGLADIESISLRTLGTSHAKTAEIYHNAYGDDFDTEALMDLKHKYIDEMIGDNGFPPKKGIHELLRYVTDKGYRLAVGSSTREWAVRTFLEKIDAARYFDIFVCGDMKLKSKPEPDIFLRCAELMELSPDRCYVLEDSFNGIRAAYKAGMKPIMVPDMIMPDEEIRSLTFAVKDDLIQVMDIL